MGFMSILSGVTNTIPGLGHVKALGHYVVGDKEGGDEALYESTRSSALLAGGVAGCLVGGPLGGAGAALYAGSLVDGFTSAATGKEKGIFKHVKNISDDISRGENPSLSILNTGLHVGFDCLGGAGMNSVAKTVSKEVVKGVGKSTVKRVCKSVGEEFIEKSVAVTFEEITQFGTRKVTETAAKKGGEKIIADTAAQCIYAGGRAVFSSRSAENSQKGRSSNSSSNSGSGSQPPRRNPNGNPRGPNVPDTILYFIVMFVEILKSIVNSFSTIKNMVLQLFENLRDHQNIHLGKIVGEIDKCGILKEAILFTVQMINRFFKSDISFMDFVDLMQFVSAFMEEKLGISPYERTKYKELLGIVLKGDFKNESDIQRAIAEEFLKIRRHITAYVESKSVSPYFRSTLSAVYHYIKHRMIPGTDNKELPVYDYLDLIRSSIDEIRYRDEYIRFCNFPSRYKALVCERYMKKYDRRVRLVFKHQGGKLVLASCFIISSRHKGDREGDGWHIKLKTHED